MAQRRMFKIDMIQSSKFMDMPDSAQIAYIRLCSFADDEGFVNNWKLTRARKKSMDILEDLGFILRFESGIILISHWMQHNKIRKDSFRKSFCTAEKALVRLNSDDVYEFIPVTEPVQSCNETVQQESIGKESVDKESIVQESAGKESLEKESLGKESVGKESAQEAVATEACGAARAEKEKEDQFSLFWEQYPKKIDRDDTWFVFKNLDEKFETIMEGLEYHKKCNQWVSDNGFFVPDPKNWLKKKGWLNKPPLRQPEKQPLPVGGACTKLGEEELAASQRAIAGM